MVFIICDVVDEIEVDLIVIGCRGIGLSDGGNNDSISNWIINFFFCFILVVF